MMQSISIEGYNFCEKHQREIDYELKHNVCTRPCYKEGKWCRYYGYRRVVKVEEVKA